MSERILMLMGSGETSPTMVTPHRAIFARLPKSAAAVILDTPFGFQENADDIAGRAREYFRNSIGVSLDIASLRNTAQATSIELETFANILRRADYLFAGPGSPTYALRQWAGTTTGELLEEKLAKGGVIAFSSAAVSTLGRFTIPVYEIYKVGEDPELRSGLNVLAAVGLDVLVIPHFNNAEGGNHDTRFCYMGETRLRILESQLPAQTAVLGLDEHTGIVIDLNAETVNVKGIGGVTIRKGSNVEVLTSNDSISLDRFKELLHDIGSGTRSTSSRVPLSSQEASAVVDAKLPATSPLLQNIEGYILRFEEAMNRRDSTECLATILDLDSELANWAADTLQSDEINKGRSAVRSMVTNLAPVLREGFIPVRDRVAPYVEGFLALRATARAEKRWGDADILRDRLDGLGVVVRDTPSGVEWDLSS